jgi:hypothetical protein
MNSNTNPQELLRSQLWLNKNGIGDGDVDGSDDGEGGDALPSNDPCSRSDYVFSQVPPTDLL